MPVLPGPTRSMLPVPELSGTPSSRRHRTFSAPDRALQRRALTPLVLGAALPAPMLEPEIGAEPISGVVLPAPGVLLPVVLSAEPLLAPALEFDVPVAAVLPGTAPAVCASEAVDSPSIAATAAAPSKFMFMSAPL
jgi:hypothetical protein